MIPRLRIATISLQAISQFTVQRGGAEAAVDVFMS